MPDRSPSDRSPRASIGIVTFEQHYGVSGVGSSRIRAHWLLAHWPEAELFRPDRRYQTLILQKAYWLEYARRFDGFKILDLCDPDFLDDERRCAAVMDACDAVTCATDALAEYASRLTRTPVQVIPDRVDLDEIGSCRGRHVGPMRTAAWFGYSTNFAMLDGIVEALPRYGVTDLIVIASVDAPYELPMAVRDRLRLTNLPWNHATSHHDLCRADVVLNPRSTEGRFRFKSLNKTVLAWALELPVAHTEQELAAWVTEGARRTEGRRRRLEVEASYDVRTSVDEYRALIAGVSATAPRAADVSQPAADVAQAAGAVSRGGDAA